MSDHRRVIGFDFFDTLVHRKCHPETILAAWCRNFIAQTRIDMTPLQLYNLRKTVEKEFKGSGKEEPAYFELLRGIWERIPNRLESESDIEEICRLSYQLEVNLEIDNIFLDEEMFELARRKRISSDKIVILSDFYLPRLFFEKVLAENGVDGLFDEIYVSSEIGLRKSSGALYGYVLNELNINAQDFTMIGDNKLSDVQIPKGMGINVEYHPYTDLNKFYLTDLEGKLNKIIKIKNDEHKFTGYIPALLLFAERLYHRARKDQCKKLLFCSREGQNLKWLFDCYQSLMYSETQIPTEYIGVSRRATLLPSLSALDMESFSAIFRQYRQLPVRDFLYSIGFELDEAFHYMEKNRISETAYISPEEIKTFVIFYDEEFIAQYEAKRHEQRDLLRQYLKEMNGGTLDMLCIVDIGWKGTIQDNIAKCLGENCHIIGYYFGLRSNKCLQNNEKIGLMFEETIESKSHDIYSHNYVELERVFAADHGQVIGYKCENNESKPCYSEDKADLEIYNYVNTWQKDMDSVFQRSVEYLCASPICPTDIERFLRKKYLQYLCLVSPKQRNVFLSFRKKVKENFGNVSGMKVESDMTFEKRDKKSFMYVDYTYRILDRFHLRALKPFTAVYCLVVYGIKLLSISLQKTFP